MTGLTRDIITPQEAGTLSDLFRLRATRTPDKAAYRYYDALNAVWMDVSWREMAKEIVRWEQALHHEKLQPGDRVAIMAKNSRLWVMFDQAALALGLVVVPVYAEDRADNVIYILQHSGAKLLLIGGPPQWDRLKEKSATCKTLKTIVTISDCGKSDDKRVIRLGDWLSNGVDIGRRPTLSPGDLASIVYTSGTTGHPKGVMLSHRNLLANAYSCAQTGMADGKEVFLSFLPLSHTFERTVGYYLPIMVGAIVAHSRSIQDLADDLIQIRPDGLISVPRIFERVYAKVKDNLAKQSATARTIFDLAVDVGWRRFEYTQGRAHWHPKLLLWPMLKRLVADKVLARLGGRLGVAISGGAALSPEVAHVFIALGVPLYQGYGLTEASPVVSVNTEAHNIPSSIGLALPDVDVRIGEQDELLVRADSVMMGYWQDEQATARVIDREGWLHTGDKARITDEYIYITGRLKDIIVMANGEKVSPVDMELAITDDSLFEQVVIVGESRPFLSALLVVDIKQWDKFLQDKQLQDTEADRDNIEKAMLERIAVALKNFPGYAQVYRTRWLKDPWTVESGLLTPTLKIKRNKILELHAAEIEAMYQGHSV